jgi:hypothetical protein
MVDRFACACGVHISNRGLEQQKHEAVLYNAKLSLRDDLLPLIRALDVPAVERGSAWVGSDRDFMGLERACSYPSGEGSDPLSTPCPFQ